VLDLAYGLETLTTLEIASYLVPELVSSLTSHVTQKIVPSLDPNLAYSLMPLVAP